MNEKIVCEVLLKSYKDLETLCEVCDHKTMSLALNNNTDIFSTIESMNKYYIEKLAYCNIKVIIDEAILKIGHCDELKYLYFQGLKYQDLIDIIELKTYTKFGKDWEYRNPENTLVNRVRTQKKKLYNYLIRRYGIEKLFDLLKDSKTLIYRYEMLLKNKQIKFSKAFILKEQQ